MANCMPSAISIEDAYSMCKTRRAAEVDGHGAGGAYGEHKRFDYFVRHLLGVTAPPWTKNDKKAPTSDPAEE